MGGAIVSATREDQRRPGRPISLRSWILRHGDLYPKLQRNFDWYTQGHDSKVLNSFKNNCLAPL
jgi:hypothetical protein